MVVLLRSYRAEQWATAELPFAAALRGCCLSFVWATFWSVTAAAVYISLLSGVTVVVVGWRLLSPPQPDVFKSIFPLFSFGLGSLFGHFSLVFFFFFFGPFSFSFMLFYEQQVNKVYFIFYHLGGSEFLL